MTRIALVRRIITAAGRCRVVPSAIICLGRIRLENTLGTTWPLEPTVIAPAGIIWFRARKGVTVCVIDRAKLRASERRCVESRDSPQQKQEAHDGGAPTRRQHSEEAARSRDSKNALVIELR